MRESKSASSLFSCKLNEICYLAASHFQSAEALAMEIPISFHEVAKFLPSHPFRGSHLLSSRDVFDKSTNLFVRPRGKSLDHLSRYVNWPADYKGFNLEGAKER